MSSFDNEGFFNSRVICDSLSVSGNLSDFRYKFIMLVIGVSSTSTHDSNRLVGIGSNMSWLCICMYILLYVAFCKLGQYCGRRNPEAGTMPYSYFERLQGLFIVHSTMNSTVHSMSLNRLEHCIRTTTMANITCLGYIIENMICPSTMSNQLTPGFELALGQCWACMRNVGT